MKEGVLEQIGLTKSEINVYLALLELGSSATGKIVDKSRASSSKIYEILDRLIQKGLASFIIKSGVKFFEAAPPERIMDYMRDKERKISEQKKELEKIIPELELKREISKYRSEATVYKGMKGLETAYYGALKLLKPKDESLVIAGPSRPETINRFFVKFNRERARRKVKLRAIWNESARGEERTLPENNPLSEVKYISQTTSASVEIFRNRVLIFPKTKDPLVISIDSQEVADSFRVQFEMWWKQDARIVRGLDAIQDIFEDMTESGHCDFIAARGYFVGLKPEYINEWEKKAIKKGFTMRNIVDIGTKGHRITSFPFAQTKYTIPKEFSKLSVFWIYGNKVVITNWVEKEPIAVIIENKHLHDMYQEQFELLWKKYSKL